jgi:hypothetical protein
MKFIYYIIDDNGIQSKPTEIDLTPDIDSVVCERGCMDISTFGIKCGYDEIYKITCEYDNKTYTTDDGKVHYDSTTAKRHQEKLIESRVKL